VSEPPDETADARLVEQQISYYRARAPEYDEWFFRQGCHDRGEDWNRIWFSEVEEVREELSLRGDNGRTRWFPAHCFDLIGGSVPVLSRVAILDEIDDTQRDFVEVEVELSDGSRRCCWVRCPKH